MLGQRARIARLDKPGQGDVDASGGQVAQIMFVDVPADQRRFVEQPALADTCSSHGENSAKRSK